MTTWRCQMKSFKKHITEEASMEDFVSFASDYLKLKEKPKVTLVKEKDDDMTTACYNPNNGEIKIVSKGRRFFDIARSIAHELVHQSQHEREGAEKLNGETGSPHEDEANAVAGRIIRKYGEKNPQFYTESLSSTIRKHKDPYAFAADMMRQQREKKVSLKRRGAASARELVAAWKRRKSK